MNYDIVLHVDTDDNCMAVALKNATNYANALPDTDFGMVLLVNGAGVRQLAKTNEAIGDKLAEVMGRGLKVRACANALRDNNLTPEMLFAGVEVVPAGLVELVHLQRAGYAYVKP